ncbi:MAG: glycosyltransferase family 2 protein, partial [bacterium]|nr:glycosyltransferase family 2 protein [bacterium]
MFDAKLVSVLVPVYNERYTISEILRRVWAAPLPEGLEREVIVVDDCSRDGTWGVLQKLAGTYPRLHLLRQGRNRGKGAAIARALTVAKGGIILFQDADLEYDPLEYPRLLAPILEGDADVVYGSRFLPADRRRVLFFRHAVGNKLLTLFSNLLTDLNLSDMVTGFKVFRASAIKTIPIRSGR